MACRKSIFTERLILLLFAQIKNVRIKWRVVGPDARYSGLLNIMYIIGLLWTWVNRTVVA